MLFKHALIWGLMFFSADTGAGAGGAGGGESESGGEAADSSEGSEAGDTSGQNPDVTSANKLIKDAAKEFGITVEQLLEKVKARDTATADLEKARDAEKDRADKAEQTARDIRAEREVEKAAAKANAIEPESIYVHVASALEFDAEGKVKNLQAAIDGVKAKYPKLFRAAQGRGDGGAKGDSAADVKPGVDRIRHAYENSDKK